MAEQNLNITWTRDALIFYIDGCLQFSSQDEHIYHEMLVHPAAGIVEGRIGSPWRALVLGGGDGLALREILRYGRCVHVDLVDHDPAVIAQARTTFSALNQGALADRRVSVRIEDARDALCRASYPYDLVIADFTFPETAAVAKLFTTGFFAELRQCLQPHGLLSMNGLSPTQHGTAFWSVYKTLAHSRLNPLPLHLCIPSFLKHGFGPWGFFFASPSPISSGELTQWKPTVRTRFAAGSRLREGLRFPSESVWTGLRLGSVIEKSSDLLYLLGLPITPRQDSKAIVDFARPQPLEDLQLLVHSGAFPVQFDEAWLLRLVEILRSMDLERLFDAVATRAHNMSQALQEQFKRLRRELPELLREQVLNIERAGQLLCVLMLLLVFLNLIYPDSAYAKGSSPGHSSGSDSEISVVSPIPATPFHMKPLQSESLQVAVNMRGATYPKKRVFTEGASQGRSEEELFYSVTDELFLTPSGRAFFSSPGLAPYYFQIKPDGAFLFREGTEAPIMSFATEDDLVKLLMDNAALQIKALDKTLSDYSKWVAWTAPLSVVSGDLSKESYELHHLSQIRAALAAVLSQFKDYAFSLERQPPGGSRKLAPGVHVQVGGVLVKSKERGWAIYPWGKTVNKEDLPVLQRVSGMDTFLEEMQKKDQGLDPTILGWLRALKASGGPGAPRL